MEIFSDINFNQLSNQDKIITEHFFNISSSIIMAIVTLFSFFIIWKVLDTILKTSFKKFLLDETTSNFILQVIRYFFLISALISSLNKLGINTTSLLASLGVVSLTIGFAARDTLSNIISGIFIFWDRPFVLNDLVDIGGVYGKVVGITLRSTRIVTPDGKMLAIPNTIIINEKVVSFTNFPNLRLDISFTVGFNENLDNIRRILFDHIKTDPDYLKEKQPTLVLKSINDYNLELELRAWIIDEKKHIDKRFELREKVYTILKNNNIEMPYETIKIEPMVIRNDN